MVGGAAVAATMVAVLVLLSSRPGGNLRLVVRLVESDAPLVAMPIAAGERFTLRYIHSVDRQPVWDEHSVDRDGHIYVAEERFVMLGAGMGHWPGHGTLGLRDSVQVIEGIDRRLDDLVVRVGDRQAGQTLSCRDRTVALADLAPGRALSITIERVGVLARLRQALERRPAGAGLAGR
jgi:hypothetical protein